MIPLKLTLQGFLSYFSEEVIDFSSVELACVSGANGAGKSSLFDAMTWALFGKARRNDDALIHGEAKKCNAARVEFEFLYEDERYRVQREKPRGKATTLEFQIRSSEGQWRSLTEVGVRATEERIRNVLHLDYETFVNASFFLQGKADMFAQQTPGKRKEILSSILGLEIWEDYREEASRRRREINGQIKGQRAYLDEILQELGEEGVRKEHLSLLQAALKNAEVARISEEKILTDARLRAQEVQAQGEKLALLEKRIAEADGEQERITKQIDARQTELETYQKILNEADRIEKSFAIWGKMREELERLNEQAQSFHQLQTHKAETAAKIQSEGARLTQEQIGLQQRASKMEEIEKRLPDLEASLQRMQKEIGELEGPINQFPEVETQLANLQNQRAELLAENMGLKAKMDELKERIEHLAAASGKTCPLCGQELTDIHRERMVTSLKKEGKALGDQYRENTAAMMEVDNLIQSQRKAMEDLRNRQGWHSKVQAEASRMDQQIVDAKNRLDEWNISGEGRLAELGDALENERFATVARQELFEIEKSIQGLGYDETAHIALRQQEAAARGIEEDYRMLEKGRVAVEGLRRELVELNTRRERLQKDTAARKDELAKQQQELAIKRENLTDIRKLEELLQNKRIEENHLRQQMGGAQQMVAVLDTLRVREEEIRSEIQTMNRQITQLHILETAFGKDGIPALLIEEALPEIETQANEVLDRLSDGRMSVSFETERKYKDERRADKRPTLDILISDASGRRDYELFSGGEAFRINFAIRLALSRVLAGRAGARLQTLVIDEGFGSQDEEGRQRLIEAINLVSPDFAKILVITHLDELKDIFPSRIEVRKTASGSQVEVIP